MWKRLYERRIQLLAERKRKEEHRRMLLKIEEARLAMEAAVTNFNFATDADLVDLYSYEMIVAKSRYDFLCKRAKEMEVSEGPVIYRGYTA